MFDSFEAFQRVQKQNFDFQPTRFETWQGGKMIENGNLNSTISARIIDENGEEKMEIKFQDQNLKNQLAFSNVFDEFITSSDRLQLITIPEQTTSENVALMMFKMNIGPTRSVKHFSALEPFCCNLFLQGGNIVKVTFSFNNPERLLEFYSDEIMEYEAKKSNDIFDSILNDFDKLRTKLLGLPSNLPYKCDVYKNTGEKLINNENGYLEIDSDEIILQTFDDSNDYISFYNNGGKLFCKYVIMNGETVIVNEEFDKVEFMNRENSNIKVNFQCSKK